MIGRIAFMQAGTTHYKSTRKVFSALIAMVLMLSMIPEMTLAGEKELTVKASSAALRSGASSSAKVIDTIDRGTTVEIYETKGDWAKVIADGKKGFMNKSAFTSSETTAKAASSKSSSSKYSKLEPGDSGASVKTMQQRLRSKGYLSSSQVSGEYDSPTKLAIRVFQLENSLSITGTADTTTLKKLYSSSAKSRKKIEALDWFKGGVSRVFPRRGSAVIVDVETGARISIRRTGGSNHADVEPKSSSDTKKLKKIYGGSWSWDSRAVILIADGHYIAAAINGMPHGQGLSDSNSFDGQFCLHLKNSKTHGSDCLNSDHQDNVKKAYNAFN